MEVCMGTDAEEDGQSYLNTHTCTSISGIGEANHPDQPLRLPRYERLLRFPFCIPRENHVEHETSESLHPGPTENN